MSLTLPAHSLEVDAGGGLRVVGATTVLGTSPSVTLAAFGWAEVTVTGSHLELLPLYCAFRGDYYELTVETSTTGACLIAVGTPGAGEIAVVSQLGERVPGGGALTVIGEEVEQLWPRLDSAVWVAGLGLFIEGSGFRVNESYCLLRHGAEDLQVAAAVAGPAALACPLGESGLQAPVIEVAVQNRIAEDLSRLLRSNTLRIETEPALWSAQLPQSISAPREQAALQVEEAAAARLVALAEALVPKGLLAGSHPPFSLNLTALSAASGLEISACAFGLARLGATGAFSS